MQFLDTNKNSASNNMSLDASFLEKLQPEDEPILHFYDWERPSLTYGYFVSLDKYLNLNLLKKKQIDFARRPTGGGIVFHLWDLAFSFLMPSGHKCFCEEPLKNYHFVNQIVQKALISFFQKKSLHQALEKEVPYFASEASMPPAFCMAQPSKYDLILQGKKAAGAAQRKKKGGYLHQGTIALIKPDPKLLFELLLDPKIAQAILEKSFFLSSEEKDLEDLRGQLKSCLKEQFLIALVSSELG